MIDEWEQQLEYHDSKFDGLVRALREIATTSEPFDGRSEANSNRAGENGLHQHAAESRKIRRRDSREFTRNVILYVGDRMFLLNISKRLRVQYYLCVGATLVSFRL